MTHKRGIRVHIEFTKANGKRSKYWVSAPSAFDVMGVDDRAAWVRRAANKHSPGATAARVVGRDRG